MEAFNQTPIPFPTRDIISCNVPCQQKHLKNVKDYDPCQIRETPMLMLTKRATAEFILPLPCSLYNETHQKKNSETKRKRQKLFYY